MSRLLIAAASASLASLAAPAMAQDVAVTNVTLATGDGSEPVTGATVVVRGGTVVAAGPGVAVPAGMRTIDGTGKWATPGLYDAVTNLGLYDADGVDESNDTGAGKSPFGAALDVAPALNPASLPIGVARNAGITRASIFSAPTASIFGGQGALVDLGADANMVTRPRAFQLVVLGERGAQSGGGSRTSAHALLRNALREARQYGSDARLTGGGGRTQTDLGDDIPVDTRLVDNTADRDDVLLTRFDAAALVPVVRGRQPLYVAVERAADIRSVLALKQEFPALDLVLLGASEGWMVARDIAAAGVPVIADALDDLPSRFEQLAATQSNVGRMRAAGVKVAIGGLSGGTGEQPRNITQYAGNLVALGKVPGATGLTWGQAFAAISSIPAEISGQGGRVGVLKTGAAGDLVLWDGDPLEVSSAPTQVFIEGVEQPMDNHQRELRDRYRDLQRGDLPKAYNW